jgi:23S rRNA (uridine2552-2'-O)-methyltransferase
MGRRFLSERRRDPYYRAAQREGLRSRAAFKLVYLDDRFRILRPGAHVLDLGAAPGGWSVVARERVGPRGRVVAVDPRRMEPIDGVDIFRSTAEDPLLVHRLGAEQFDVILSDMSPRISGAYSTDHARSVTLAAEALRVAEKWLRTGGTLVAKVFAGDMLDELVASWRGRFRRVDRTKPPASRLPSSEMYLIGRGYLGSPAIAP